MAGAKQITFTYENKTYTLEYDRRTVKLMERRGFNLDELGAKPLTLLPQLFWGAFQKHHRNVPQDTTDKMLDSFKDREALYGRLTEMYTEPILTLMDDEESEGNVEWEPNW